MNNYQVIIFLYYYDYYSNKLIELTWSKSFLKAKNRLDYYEDLQCDPVSTISKNPNQKVRI